MSSLCPIFAPNVQELYAEVVASVRLPCTRFPYVARHAFFVDGVEKTTWIGVKRMWIDWNLKFCMFSG